MANQKWEEKQNKLTIRMTDLFQSQDHLGGSGWEVSGVRKLSPSGQGQNEELKHLLLTVCDGFEFDF
jgi:hypothetical protein